MADFKTYTTTDGKQIKAKEDGRKVYVRSKHRSATTGEYARIRQVLKADDGRLYLLNGAGQAQHVTYKWLRSHLVKEV